MKTYLCRNCCTEIVRNTEDVSEGYFGACLECDEDFYEFEVIVPPDKV